MAYQNVATPRFYVDLGQYLLAVKDTRYANLQTYSEHYFTFSTQKIIHLMSLNPTKIVSRPNGHIGAQSSPDDEFVKVKRAAPIRYVAYLGHNGGWLIPGWTDEYWNAGTSYEAGPFDGVNIHSGLAYPYPQYSGFSIFTFEDNANMAYLYASAGDRVDGTKGKLGAISVGDYYDMPNSPDLDIKLSYEYDGVNTLQSKTGATTSNAMYVRPANWSSPAWTLGAAGRDWNMDDRTGRRTWDLSFSYLSDSDISPLNAQHSYFTGSEEDNFETNIMDGTDFFSTVWNKTLGNVLPFIFQPDNTNNEPDQFAICKFINDTLEYEQVAPNVYDIKLKIKEVW